ncbi:Clavaminate synthase-like protein [Sistotremastrum niveocremeum HHB9708]|uniref:Clavaminate synthase-like protein n=1 Tax=Sistotremastrum niveocremeum HHB9708 TaxID=1314777 RepID=A0A164X5Z9_9AGAM|nr:Clavaminate synthase-like protein [Sistotremastrum niveocremeum HHB9708]
MNTSLFSDKIKPFLDQLKVEISEGIEGGDLYPNDADTTPILKALDTLYISETHTGDEVLDIVSSLDSSIGIANDVFRNPGHSGNAGWRQYYTDCAIVATILEFIFGDAIKHMGWEASIQRTDLAIIVAGSPGPGRLYIIYDLIEAIQGLHLPILSETPKPSSILSKRHPPVPRLHSAELAVPCLTRPPSLQTFLSTEINAPFVLRSHVNHWPAVSRWDSLDYLYRVGGRGRVVPVEIGSDYTSEDWTQRFMPWHDFLDRMFSDSPSEPSETVYLAQHSLLTQFPDLRNDIILPDYVYSGPSAPDTYPQYKPPGNEEQLVINAWLGPRGTISPAHTDPYFNCYAQVVGRKTIWLAPPSLSNILSTHARSHPLYNTSSINVFQSDLPFPADFVEHVVPHAITIVLEPGDLLCMPPGWWHAMRSEETCFSVSMWF